MLTVADALDRLIATVVPFDVWMSPLNESLGLTLGTDIYSSIDSPPFDKSLMDGYAVRAADVTRGSAVLDVIEIVTAGRIPTRQVGVGQAIQVMTGAPIPDGADTVIKVEETTPDGDRVRITAIAPSGLNLLRRGTSVRKGDCVLKAGMKLNGSRIGALAELGCATVAVRRRPKVAILATGDELVPVDATPGPGQIRNSNESMLVAQIANAGGVPVPLGIVRDNRQDLQTKIRQGLQADVLVLSGGVSAGTLDLVPSELAAANVREIFHKVELKPGKPIWFGWKPATAGEPPCYVFGLPGNPVSSLVCCELFVRTAIRRLIGEEPAIPLPIYAALEHSYSTKADRPTYHPAKVTWTADGPAVTLVPWIGSADLCGTIAANAMALLSGETRQFTVGERLPVFLW